MARLKVLDVVERVLLSALLYLQHVAVDSTILETVGSLLSWKTLRGGQR